jgi:hypothetical protein
VRFYPTGNADDALPQVRRRGYLQIVDVSLDLLPGPDRVFGQQLPECLYLLLHPTVVDVNRQRGNPSKLRQLLFELV